MSTLNSESISIPFVRGYGVYVCVGCVKPSSTPKFYPARLSRGHPEVVVTFDSVSSLLVCVDGLRRGDPSTTYSYSSDTSKTKVLIYLYRHNIDKSFILVPRLLKSKLPNINFLLVTRNVGRWSGQWPVRLREFPVAFPKDRFYKSSIQMDTNYEDSRLDGVWLWVRPRVDGW